MSTTDPAPFASPGAAPAGRDASDQGPVPAVWRTGRALFIAQITSGALGTLAWLVAARSFPSNAVGTAIALTGALMWAGLVGNLGLGSLMVALLPAARRLERPTLAGTAAATAAAAGGTIGLVVACMLRLLSGELRATVDQPAVVAAVAIGAAAWASGVVLDHVAVASDRATVTITRSVTSGAARLALIALALHGEARSAAALVIGWGVAAALGTAVAAVSLWSTSDLSWNRRVATRTARPLARRATRTHYAINVLGQTPPMALPLVLAACGRPVQAAAFGAAWQLASAVGLLSPAVATGLFAAGSADRTGADQHTRRAKRQIVAVVGTAAIVLALAGPLALAAVGRDYTGGGSLALRLLAVALVADALTNIEVARLRVARRYRDATLVNAAIAAIAVLGAALLASRWGAPGAASAWLLAQAAGVAVALRLRSPSPARSLPHEDLARLRVEPAGAGERRGPGHLTAVRSTAEHRPRGVGPARHRRRSGSWTGVRYGPWSASPGSGAGRGRAS